MYSIFQIEELVTSCRGCNKSFGPLNARSHCRVCGESVCDACSTKDLIVYLEGKENKRVKLRIINIIRVSVDYARNRFCEGQCSYGEENMFTGEESERIE